MRALAVLAAVTVASSMLAFPALAVPRAHLDTVVVPNVVGMRMDRSTALLHARGFRVNEECPSGLFGCILKSNWYICRTYPAAGQRVPRYSKIITYGVRHRGDGC